MTCQVHDNSIEDPSANMSPLVEVWSIAWPTILTMTSYTVMQFMDGLMVGQYSPTALAAQSNGGIWAFTPLAWVMGALTVVNTYVAQNLGAKTPENGPRFAWSGLWLAAVTWLFIMVPFALAMPLLFSTMGDHSPELQRMESGYAQILLAGSLMHLGARAISQYFFGMHRPKVITVATICGNIVNVVCNYVLIFGERGIPTWGLPGVPGMPALGVHGAAIGTIMGTAVEFAIPMCIFLGPKLNAKYRTRSAWRLDLRTVGQVVKLGVPCSVQWGNEVICWAIFMSVLVGKFGEAHMTAGWIALKYMHLGFMPAIGLSVAVNSLVGKYIGAGQPDTAKSRAHLGLKIAVFYMTTCGILFWVFRYPMVKLFVANDLSPAEAAEIIEIGGKIMICAAVFQTVDAFGIIFTGALRGAGDTLWPSVATVVYSWLCIIGLGWLLSERAPQLTSVGPWIGAAVYIALYGVTMAYRFESGGWRKINLLDRPDDFSAESTHSPSAGPSGPAPPASTPDASIRDIGDMRGD